MNPTEQDVAVKQEVPPPVERLLTGLWQQREELGLIADELLDIFRRYGFAPPRDRGKGG